MERVTVYVVARTFADAGHAVRSDDIGAPFDRAIQVVTSNSGVDVALRGHQLREHDYFWYVDGWSDGPHAEQATQAITRLRAARGDFGVVAPLPVIELTPLPDHVERPRALPH